MPYARIEIPTTWSLCSQQQLLDAIDSSFESMLGVPRHDAFLRIYTYNPLTSAKVPRCHGNDFLFVEIQLFSGRSLETKRQLYRDLKDRFIAYGLPENDVTIVLVEIPFDNWGLKDGAELTTSH